MDKIIVSVLLPMYNASAYIEEAVNSILHQTYTFFELIIIDDCSTDNSLSIVQKLTDHRIIIIKKEQKSGLSEALNLGLHIAKGKYIARMDADDISLPERFQKQVQYMELHEDVILCGTWFQILGSNEKIKHPETHEAIVVALLEYCAIGHPTVMFRKDFFIRKSLLYDKTKEPAEDHHLWVTACSFGKLYNIPEVLLKYRLHNSGVSISQKQKQEIYSQKVKRFHLSLIYKDHIPQTDITKKPVFDGLPFCEQKKYFKNFIRELEKANQINESKVVFDRVLFTDFCLRKKKMIVKKWFFDSGEGSLKKLLIFLAPSTSYYRYFTNNNKAVVIFKCLNPFNW